MQDAEGLICRLFASAAGLSKIPGSARGMKFFENQRFDAVFCIAARAFLMTVSGGLTSARICTKNRQAPQCFVRGGSPQRIRCGLIPRNRCRRRRCWSPTSIAINRVSKRRSFWKTGRRPQGRKGGGPARICGPFESPETRHGNQSRAPAHRRPQGPAGCAEGVPLTTTRRSNVSKKSVASWKARPSGTSPRRLRASVANAPRWKKSSTA